MSIFKKQKKDIVVEKIKRSREEEINEKYKRGLKKSRESLVFKIRKLKSKHVEINDQYFKDLEEILILADLGVFYVEKILEHVKSQAKIKKIKSIEETNALLYKFLRDSYEDKKKETDFKLNIIPNKLNIILVIGVNGVGKTTSIAKLSNYLKKDNLNISLAAADTFRAGAVAQLKEWSNRLDLNITVPNKDKEDPGAVVYRAITSAKERNDDVLIIDTAGRLNNKKNLMQELEKIKRIILKTTGQEINETLLVIDATTGQNGVHQAASFNEIVDLTGIILTKMDSSAKGGIILSINQYFKIPVKFIGLGESISDLEEFNLKKYLDNLIGTNLE